MNPIISITCTCTHGGGGHMEACAFFTPTKEQYLEVCAERNKLRKVAKAADAFLTAYDAVDGGPAPPEAEALDYALDALNVPDGSCGTVRPWWFKYE